MLSHLQIFLQFTRETGHQHPHRLAALDNYGALLEEMGLSREAIGERLRALLAEDGLKL